MKPLPLLLIGLLAPPAAAQTVPRRQIPDTVLAELQVLERRFEAALADDCHPGVCVSKGCAYGDHAVIDRPRATSMPGLGEAPTPGPVVPQEFLTQATCAFAYEPTVSAADAELLSRRLQSKVSHGFTSVGVSRQELQPLPPSLQVDPSVPPPAPEAPEAPPPEPPAWSTSLAARELWTQLLPHWAWMIAVVLLTGAAVVLFWAWRRVGRETIDEKLMMAQLLNEAPEPPASGEPELPSSDVDAAFVAEARAGWDARLAAVAAGAPDVELQALIRELLRDSDFPTLAKAALTFPGAFVGAFPSGGDVAAAKLALAEYLKVVDPEQLPDDATFFRGLARLNRAAALAAQGDASLVRSLRDEFGGPGLVALIEQLPARPAALLFALAPAEERLEVGRLLPPPARRALAEPLLRSNRMDPDESDHLFAVLAAARAGERLPAAPTGGGSERGAPFDALGPLSMLLHAVEPDDRAALFVSAIERFQGTLPAWHRGLVYPDLLLAVSREGRADLMLEVDPSQLAAWLAVNAGADRLLEGAPRALRASIDGAELPAERPRLLQLAEAARVHLARSLQRQLAREGVAFEAAVVARPGEPA